MSRGGKKAKYSAEEVQLMIMNDDDSGDSDLDLGESNSDDNSTSGSDLDAESDTGNLNESNKDANQGGNDNSEVKNGSETTQAATPSPNEGKLIMYVLIENRSSHYKEITVYCTLHKIYESGFCYKI